MAISAKSRQASRTSLAWYSMQIKCILIHTSPCLQSVTWQCIPIRLRSLSVRKSCWLMSIQAPILYSKLSRCVWKRFGNCFDAGSKPIAFASKPISDFATRCANIGREMLAVVFGGSDLTRTSTSLDSRSNLAICL